MRQGGGMPRTRLLKAFREDTTSILFGTLMNIFFAMAATQMRRILVDHARAAATRKRGAGARRITLVEEARRSEGTRKAVRPV